MEDLPQADDIVPVQRKTGRCSAPFHCTLLRGRGDMDVRPPAGTPSSARLSFTNSVGDISRRQRRFDELERVDASGLGAIHQHIATREQRPFSGGFGRRTGGCGHRRGRRRRFGR